MSIQYTFEDSIERKNGIIAISDMVTGCPRCNGLTNLLYKPLDSSNRLYKACSKECADILSGKE